jgi:pentatricopeptide repeat protein
MKELIITIAAFGLLCSPALAMEKCETEIPDMTKRLIATEEISDQSKKTYISHLEEALKLCKAGDLEKADDMIKKMQDQFFRDALYNHETFYGN